MLTIPNVLITHGQTVILSIHLDYALKAKYPGALTFESTAQTTYAKGYAFAATVDPTAIDPVQADTATVAAVGKKVTAIGGFLLDVNGAPKGGLTVQVTSKGDVIGQSISTSDGFYFVPVTPGGPYKVEIINSIETYVAIDVFSISKDQFMERDFTNLSPADPAINGFVTDTSSNPISGVQVQLLNKQGKQLATTTTNPGGYYIFRFPMPGTYTIKITAPADYIASITAKTLRISQFETAQVDFNLAGK